METNTAYPTVKLTVKQIIAAAFAYVYTDADKLIQDVAKEHAIANMGHELGDFITEREWLSKHPEQVISSCWNNWMGQIESDEMADGQNDERKVWLKQAKKDVAAVQKKKLPLTMENVMLAFEGKGPFEKKTRTKK